MIFSLNHLCIHRFIALGIDCLKIIINLYNMTKQILLVSFLQEVPGAAIIYRFVFSLYLLEH